MDAPRIIVADASAGGVPPLSSLIPTLPADQGTATFVCVDTLPTDSGLLPAIFSNWGHLPGVSPADGKPLPESSRE